MVYNLIYLCPIVHCNSKTNYGCGGKDQDKDEPGRTLSWVPAFIIPTHQDQPSLTSKAELRDTQFEIICV